MNGKEVLFLTKEQAVHLSNFSLSSFQLRERFKVALLREEKLHELWQATSRQLKTQKELTTKAEQALALREEELKDIKKLHKKEKRKKFMQNTATGLVIGIVGTLFLTQ